MFYVCSVLLCFKLFIYFCTPFKCFGKSLNIVFVILISLVLFSLVNSFEKVVENHKRMKEQSFKPFFQLFKVLILSLSLIFIYSGLTGKSPTTVLTMLGAVSAELLLIFQDTIRNLVAYIQIVARN